MNSTFDKHIGIFTNGMSDKWCDDVISYYESNPEGQVSRKDSDGGVPTNLKNDNIFQGTLSEDFKNTTVTPFFETLINCFHVYDEKYNVSHNGLVLGIADFKIQKTLPTEGYHMWHYEYETDSPTPRIVVWSIYLNDVEEGGETEFLHQSKRIKPKKGSILMWPAGYTHIHRGNPPLSGEKYIVTGWMVAQPPNT
jgi:hypothetical protein